MKVLKGFIKEQMCLHLPKYSMMCHGRYRILSGLINMLRKQRKPWNNKHCRAETSRYSSPCISPSLRFTKNVAFRFAEDFFQRRRMFRRVAANSYKHDWRPKKKDPWVGIEEIGLLPTGTLTNWKWYNIRRLRQRNQENGRKHEAERTPSVTEWEIDGMHR